MVVGTRSPQSVWERPRDIEYVGIDDRTFSSDTSSVTGNEFIRKVKDLGKARGVTVVLDASRGKGSHQTLYFGRDFTVVRNPKDELKTGTFHAMCTQLRIKPRDL